MRKHQAHQSVLNATDSEEEEALNDFVETAKELSTKKINCTFLGVGLDVNTALLPRFIKIPGCSYFSISATKESREALLKEQFEYRVHPAATELSLELHASPFEVGEVCGDHSAAVSRDGRFFFQDTLYPSATTEQGLQGSMVLLRLVKGKGTKELPELAQVPATQVAIKYTDLHGRSIVDYHELMLKFHPEEVESGKSAVDVEMFESSAVRKGILLHEYVALVHELLDWRYGPLPVGLTSKLNTFADHFQQEVEALQDEKLLDEVSMWGKLQELSEQKHGKRSQFCVIS